MLMRNRVMAIENELASMWFQAEHIPLTADERAARTDGETRREKYTFLLIN